MRDFSIHDVRFRLIAEDSCAIVVFGHDVGELRKHGDAFDPDLGPWFTAMLFDSEAPPIRIDQRGTDPPRHRRCAVGRAPGSRRAANPCRRRPRRRARGLILQPRQGETECTTPHTRASPRPR